MTDIILEKVNESKWIIDGTYVKTLKHRLEKSDLIIYLDYSSIAQLKGVLGRYIKNHGKEKPDMPGCKEKFDMSFILYVATYKKQRRDIILEILQKGDKEKLLIFKNTRELQKWVSKLENK